tara:strand:- start:1743 stop:2732 length:990 start_codon:yes stop_codon:yes gene_type:complete
MTKETKDVISIIVPTRDRVALLTRAIDSIRKQHFAQWEVILVDTGKSEVTLNWYRNLGDENKSQVRYFSLKAPEGVSSFGPSAARNYGVFQSKGSIIAFLDDDDEWIDDQHLSNVHKYINLNKQADVYISQQEAVKSENKQVIAAQNGIWLEKVNYKSIAISSESPGVYLVDSLTLLNQGNFCHLNCLALKRKLFDKTGGFDESLRYEEDKEFYFRALNNCRRVLVTDHLSSRHYIPKRNTASTSIDRKVKLLYQLQLVNKSLCYCLSPRSRFKWEKSMTLKKLAEDALEREQYTTAYHFALCALSSRFSLKWAFYTLILWLKSKPKLG